MSLIQDSITFGKYDGKTLSVMLRDRQYCKWILEQEWFRKNYVYLFNRIKEYNPLSFFINEIETTLENNDFLSNYIFFNLNEPPIQILSDDENKCYRFYFESVMMLKDQIKNNIVNGSGNPFDIKTPNRWLQRFESETDLSREFFKEVLCAYELPNLPFVIEEIKRQGGITYNGANSFKIGKERSKQQEEWWEKILKDRYGEDINAQFKFKNCFFDFINIATNTIFECKLSLKDFNESQFEKYKVILNQYRIIYLIGTDCVIHMDKKVLYTTDPAKYFLYVAEVQYNSKLNYLDSLIQNFKIIKVDDVSRLFGKR
jgi:hypothetical protein